MIDESTHLLMHIVQENQERLLTDLFTSLDRLLMMPLPIGAHIQVTITDLVALVDQVTDLKVKLLSH